MYCRRIADKDPEKEVISFSINLNSCVCLLNKLGPCAKWGAAISMAGRPTNTDWGYSGTLCSKNSFAFWDVGLGIESHIQTNLTGLRWFWCLAFACTHFLFWGPIKPIWWGCVCFVARSFWFVVSVSVASDDAFASLDVSSKNAFGIEYAHLAPTSFDSRVFVLRPFGWPTVNRVNRVNVNRVNVSTSNAICYHCFATHAIRIRVICELMRFQSSTTELSIAGHGGQKAGHHSTWSAGAHRFRRQSDQTRVRPEWHDKLAARTWLLENRYYLAHLLASQPKCFCVCSRAQALINELISNKQN